MKKIPPVVVLRSAIVTLIGLTYLTGFAQEVEVKGEIKCGPPLSGGQGYSQPISMRVQDGYGTGIMETADVLENQELVLAADGSVRYNAIGIWKNQPNRRWRIYGIGSLDGLSIKASGGMYGNTAAELVRPKCEIQRRMGSPLNRFTAPSRTTSARSCCLSMAISTSPKPRHPFSSRCGRSKANP